MSKTQRNTIVVLTGLALMAALYFLDGILDDSSGRRDGKVAGEVLLVQNDTRYREVSTLNWRGARRRQFVHVGDSLFTGSQSRAKVKLTQGGELDMDENTLVTFGDEKGGRIPMFEQGNFLVRVRGQMQVKVGGKVMTLQGDGSDVQIYFRGQGEPRARVLSGRPVMLHPSGKRTFLPRETVLAFGPNDLEVTAPAKENQALSRSLAAAKAGEHKPSALPEPEAAFTGNTPEPPRSVPAPVVPEPPKPAPPPFAPTTEARSYAFTYKLSEVYGRDGPRIVAKKSLPEVLKRDVAVAWPLTSSDVRGDLIAGSRRWPVEVKGPSMGFVVDRVAPGANSVRLSPDGGEWKEETFRAEFGFSPQAPDIAGDRREFPMENSGLRLPLTSADPFPHVLVEFARDRRFKSSVIRLHKVSADKTVKLRFPAPGTYFVRMRGVSAQEELSRFSPLRRLRIYDREPAALPLAAPPAAAPSPVEPPPPPPPPLQKAAGKLEPPPPQPTAQSRVRTNRDYDGVYINKAYNHSRLGVEGAVFGMYSRDFLNQAEGQEPPAAFLLGLRNYTWWDKHGLEAGLKTKTINANSTGQINSPTQAELRYLRRWMFGWNPFFSFKESQIALIGGYELYRNTGGGLFSRGYGLFKTGFSLSFPAFYHWDTGGEVLYGMDPQGDRKYEISGHIHYYLKSRWSLGFGYRLHLLDVVSPSVAPSEVPYREGYGEGYSVLRWHY